MRAMTGELRDMPFVFIAARTLGDSCFSALAPPPAVSASTSEPVQPAIARAAVNNPARSKLAIILSASSPAAGAFHPRAGQIGKSAGSLGRLTLKIDYHKR